MDEAAAAPDWERFRAGASELGVELTPEQLQQLRRYLERLREWNRRFNLTALEDPNEILVKHFLDSLTCALVVDFRAQRNLLDVGTGAGFPGLVLKLAFPHLAVTLLDAVQKRLRFLEHVAEELGLSGVTTLHARAEDAARGVDPRARAAARRGGVPAPSGPAPLRERFDVVVARAVARLNVLVEWLLPFARVGGVALAMKGPAPQAEVAEAERAIRLLGGGAPQIRELTLPGTTIGRSLILIPKERPTPPTYPRPPGSARKAPL